MHQPTRRAFASLLLAATGLPLVRLNGKQKDAAAIHPPGDAFAAQLLRLMDVSGVPGVGIGVVGAGKAAVEQYYGVADASTKAPLSAATLFPAASLGKGVFAYAVLRLVDDGKLDLDKPLRDYVSGHAPADARGDKVTARHVLSHSTGYRNWRSSVDQPLIPDFDPGSRFQYSGEGFFYLQHAVEKIAGQGIDQFMKQQVFDPFGMTSSSYGWRADAETRLVSGHNRGVVVRQQNREFINRLFQYAQAQGKPFASFTQEDVAAAMAVLRPAPPVLPNFMVPNVAGGLLTTVSDYTAFLTHVLSPSGVSREIKEPTRQKMFSPVTKINSVLSWGLSWGLESDNGREYAWHWGDNGSFKNFVLAHVPTRSAVVVFTNAANGMRVCEAVVNAASNRRHPAFDWL